MSNRTPLERVMNERRLKYGMRWRDVLAAADNLSPETLRRVRLQGTAAVDDFTIARIEKALRLNAGGLREMELRANESQDEVGVAPLSASVSDWDAETRAPEAPLQGDELLRWQQTERGRLYRLDDGPLSVEYTFGADETPADVIDDLRDLMDQYRVNAKAMERRRARR